jgi:SAM-dependent methyltransferase
VAQTLIRDFLSDLTQVLDMPDPVVEFGSLQVEDDQDGDMRPLFPGREFVGTDMRAGPGVDRVEDLRALRFADGAVGTALCLDTLEHCEDPPAACRELHRVVADGGVCVISSVLLFGIHAYPSDYFRFTPEGFRSMLGGFDDVWVAGIGDPGMPVQVVGVGVKGRELDLSVEQLPSLARAQADWDQSVDGVRFGVFMVEPRDVARELVKQAPRLVRQRLSRTGTRRTG